MAEAAKILRRSIHAFFKDYHSFAVAAAVLALPFSAVLLLSQSFTPATSPVLRTLSLRLHKLFGAAGFPAASQFFSLLNLKLSQTLFSFLFCLPLTVTFFVLAKAAVVQLMLEPPKQSVTFPALPSLLRLHRLILPTHLFNSFVVLSANAAVFSLLFLSFNALDAFGLSSGNSILGLSAASAVLYSIVLANAAVACSLATIVSAAESCRGCAPALKACVLLQGKEATAITVTLPASLGMAATEALFQYRITRPYLRLGRFSVAAAGEALLIAYMYSLLIVLDTVVSYMLYRTCKMSVHDQMLQLEEEQKDELQA